jgi:citrate synthase
MKPSLFFTATEAARELGVRPATLYAYVSRGLIRSESLPGSQRARRYRAEDVQRLKDRHDQRRDPAKSAERALSWGDPVLESAITLIADGRLYYRGRDALALAAGHSLEEVAALIWTGDLAPGDALFAGPEAPLSRELRAAQAGLAGLAPMPAFQALLPLAGAADLAGYDLRPAAVAATGARILRLLARVAVGGSRSSYSGKARAGRRVSRPAEGGASESGIAATLARAWVPGDRQARRLVSAALVLCADHELNVSAFTARCAASAGATPYAVVTAGLAALTGAKHGGHGERVEAFLREAGTPGGMRAAIAGRLKRGEPLPGFGHALYPEGDPRCAELLRLAAEAYPKSPAVALARAATRQAFDLVGERPNLDFGLVVLSRALGLPPGGAIALFAIGRTIGWIGHAIEQYALDRLIRPRARYVGKTPADL